MHCHADCTDPATAAGSPHACLAAHPDPCIVIAFRAQCTPDMPGCYTRKEHFFSLLSNTNTISSNPVGTTEAVAAHSKLQQQAVPQLFAATAGGTATSPRLAGALRGTHSPSSPSSRPTAAAGRHAVKLNVSPPRVSSGRYVGAGASGSKASPTAGSRSPGRLSREPEPRSTLPKPSVWRG